MAQLQGNTIASTYTGLLSVSGAVGADTVEAVTDGAGTSTSLSLSQQRATITLGSGAADDFIVDGTTLVVEGDNNRVGIRTSSPAVDLDIEDTTASSATQGGNLRLASNDGAVMASGHRLGVLEFAGAEDTSSTMTVGARIEAITDAAWSASENGADMLFYTTDGNASQSEVLRLTADGKVGVGGDPSSTQGYTGILGISGASDTALVLHSEVGGTANKWEIGNNTSGVLQFAHSIAGDGSTGTKVVIDSIGNVGIGDTDPSEAKLSIDNVAAGDYGLLVVQGQDKQAVYIDNNNNDTGLMIENTGSTGRAAYLYSNQGSGQSVALVEFVVDAPAFDQPALYIDMDGLTNDAIQIDFDGTSGNCIDISYPTNTTGTCLKIQNANALDTASIAEFHSDSNGTGTRKLVNIINDNDAADDATCLYVTQDSNAAGMRMDCTESAYSNTMLFLDATVRNGDTGFNFLLGYTDGDDDIQHKLDGNGATYNRSGTFSAADYAEYFESEDGSQIAVGTTVKLDGDKIVPCESGDTPLGVVRPLASSIVGNSSWGNWQGKYLTDDYGSPVKEEYTVTEWIDGKDKDGGNNDIQYQTDKIPSDVIVPGDATVTSTEKDGSKLMRKKLNPDYDESTEYEPREERDEWHIVGLLGQIPITKGQPMANNWIKMKDISDTVEMYFVK